MRRTLPRNPVVETPKVRVVPEQRVRREQLVWLLPLMGVFMIIVLRNAWVAEDAFIMFRTIDNFVNGYGLTWNVGERVQTYTNPLWTFIMSGVYLVTGDLYYSSIFMGALCSLAAVWLLGARIAKSFPAMLLAILPLLFSKAFIDYATSGLENPFSFLMLALFYWLYFRPLSVTPARNLFLLSFIAALAVLNRMDTLLLFAPALAYEFFRLRHIRYVPPVILGFLPFILWEIFSIIYYGFPFPNTAYAKLNTGVATAERINQGLHYLLNSLHLDPLTLLTITVALAVIVVTRHYRSLPLGISIVLYLLYTLRVGGDFMSGRFLSAPLFAATISIAHLGSSLLTRQTAVALAVMVGIIGFSSPYNPILSNRYFGTSFALVVDQNGIADERGAYFQTTGLLNSNTREFPNHLWRTMGEAAGRDAAQNPVVVFGNIGLFGYYAGPEIYIVDFWALADPLMARLPAEPGSRVGHFTRKIPPGYVETQVTGENRIVDPALAEYYDALLSIVRGPLFSRERFDTIYRMNTGAYDHLLEQYLASRRFFWGRANMLEHGSRDAYGVANWSWVEGLTNPRLWSLEEHSTIEFEADAGQQISLRFAFDNPIAGQSLHISANEQVIATLEELAPGAYREEHSFTTVAGTNRLVFTHGDWNHHLTTFAPDPRPLALLFTQLELVALPE